MALNQQATNNHYGFLNSLSDEKVITDSKQELDVLTTPGRILNKTFRLYTDGFDVYLISVPLIGLPTVNIKIARLSKHKNENNKYDYKVIFKISVGLIDHIDQLCRDILNLDRTKLINYIDSFVLSNVEKIDRIRGLKKQKFNSKFRLNSHAQDIKQAKKQQKRLKNIRIG